jgi:hypothetical protein
MLNLFIVFIAAACGSYSLFLRNSRNWYDSFTFSGSNKLNIRKLIANANQDDYDHSYMSFSAGMTLVCFMCHDTIESVPGCRIRGSLHVNKVRQPTE